MAIPILKLGGLFMPSTNKRLQETCHPLLRLAGSSWSCFHMLLSRSHNSRHRIIIPPSILVSFQFV